MNRSLPLLLLAGFALIAFADGSAEAKGIKGPARKNISIASPLNHFSPAAHKGSASAIKPRKATPTFKMLNTNTKALAGTGTSANGLHTATPEDKKDKLEDIEKLELEDTLVSHY